MSSDKCNAKQFGRGKRGERGKGEKGGEHLTLFSFLPVSPHFWGQQGKGGGGGNLINWKIPSFNGIFATFDFLS